jgi:hypothetical protein
MVVVSICVLQHFLCMESLCGELNTMIGGRLGDRDYNSVKLLC